MKFFFISPIGATSPGLFETFPETFQKEGHSIVDRVEDSDCVFFDSHSGYLPYDKSTLHYVLQNSLPVIWVDAFDYDGDSSKNWFGFKGLHGSIDLINQHDWANFFFLAKEKCRVLYFMRKMQTNVDYGRDVYPFEYCMFPDHEFPIVSKEELINRPVDICFIGAKSPKREEIINGIIASDMFTVDFQFTQERIPHEEWLNRARRSKFFLTADGGGIGDERPFQLMYIAPMLRQSNLAKRINDFQSGWDCVDLQLPTTSKRWWLDLSLLSVTLNDPEFHYKMYLRGIEKMRAFYSWEFRAMYILEVIKNNL